ncbi:hypothetical protein HAX54_037726, partial [Datura stramonium]|nr:hypothetical protein [Datura stramonium]
STGSNAGALSDVYRKYKYGLRCISKMQVQAQNANNELEMCELRCISKTQVRAQMYFENASTGSECEQRAQNVNNGLE